MNRTDRVVRSLPKLVLTVVALGNGSNAALASGGGGHGGGGHGGGAGHVGAFHGGYYGHGYGYGGYGYGGYGYGRGYWGGWGPYGYWGYPYGGFGIGIGLGYGYGYGYGSGYGGYNYLGYPYYGSGYGAPYYGSPASIYGVPSPAAADPYYGRAFPYGSLGATTSAAPGFSGLPGTGPTPVPSGVPTPPVSSADTEVTLIVRVPTNATVWVNGVKTNQNGLRREFTSAGLTPGRSYTFLVRAHWDESDGNVVDNERRITLQAGERRSIDFGAAIPAYAPPAPVAVPTIAKP